MDKRKDFLPFARPLIGEEEINEVVDALKSGWISAGPKTKQFEDDIKNYVGCKHAIAVNSCTAALHISLLALGLKQGDEVITTPFTFTSTASTIIHCGAKPVFSDIDKNTYNIDPAQIEQKITPKTKGIVPVHYAGHPCDMNEIRHIAEKHNLFVMEDAAHAIGAEYKKQKIGTLSDISCFSFYATKNMTTGEGGMAVTNDDKIAQTLKLLRWYGIDNTAMDRYSGMGSWYYEIIHAGFKYNLSDVHAALGIHQLKKLDNFISIREKYAKEYDEKLTALGITVPAVKPYVKHARHLYPVLLPKADYRDKFIQILKDNNVGTSVHFIPLHLHPYYQKTLGYKKGNFPVAEEIYSRLVSLPLCPAMSENDINYVVECVKLAINELENGK